MSDADDGVQQVSLDAPHQMEQIAAQLAVHAGMHLLTDANFNQMPDLSGTMQAQDDGTVKVTGPGLSSKTYEPVTENDKATYQYGRQGDAFEYDSTTDVYDSSGKLVQDILQRDTADNINDILLGRGWLTSDMTYAGPDNIVNLEIAGHSNIDPSIKTGFDGSDPRTQPQIHPENALPTPGHPFIADWNSNSINSLDKGYLGEVHLSANPEADNPNVIDITASFSNNAARGGKGGYIEDVDMKLTLDPNNPNSATYTIGERYAPQTPAAAPSSAS